MVELDLHYPSEKNVRDKPGRYEFIIIVVDRSLDCPQVYCWVRGPSKHQWARLECEPSGSPIIHRSHKGSSTRSRGFTHLRYSVSQVVPTCDNTNMGSSGSPDPELNSLVVELDLHH